MIVRTLLVGTLLLVAVALLGYLFLIHPEGPRILKSAGGSPQDRPAPTAPAAPGPEMTPGREGNGGRPLPPVDAPAPEQLPRSRQHQAPPAAAASRSKSPAPGRPPIPEEQVRGSSPPNEDSPPPVRNPEPYAGAGGAVATATRAGGGGSLSHEQIERIIQIRRRIQRLLDGEP
jgi:hypothetical protein